ncbi:MAG TPA: hypothetical protein VJ801_03915, partial [Polyangia bacterium]|nr:hypothetical protein [Polyangia bacterium]
MPYFSILGISSLSALVLFSACSGSGSGRADGLQNDAGQPSTGGTTMDAGDTSSVTADAALAPSADGGDAPATGADGRDASGTGPDTRDAPATRADAGNAPAPDAAGRDGGATAYPTSCDDIGTEPVIPPTCSTVLATKTVVAGAATTDADEAALDTDAIQAAINNCPAGQSVKLAADG